MTSDFVCWSLAILLLLLHISDFQRGRDSHRLTGRHYPFNYTPSSSSNPYYFKVHHYKMKFLPQKARKNKTTTAEFHSSSDDISDLTHSNYGSDTTNNGQQHHNMTSTSTTAVTAATRSKKSSQSRTNEKSKDTLTKYNNLSSPNNRRLTITEGILSLPTTSTPPRAVQRSIHNFRREPLLSRSITSSQHKSISNSSAISLDGQIIAAKHKQQQPRPLVSNSPSSKVDTINARGAKLHPTSKSKEGGGGSSSNENNETNNASQTKVGEKKNYTRPKIRQHPEWDKCERSTTVTMVPYGSRRGMFVCLLYVYRVVYV